LRKVTRREFLKGSAAIATSIAATRAAHAAATSATDPQPESRLYLPPLLSSPTETSIRVSALNGNLAAEAFIELRKDGQQ
jgi:hypothetical protein